MSETDGKLRPLAEFRLHKQAGAVPGEDMLDDGKPQSGTLLGAAVGDADAIETLGQARNVLRRYARPLVDDIDFDRQPAAAFQEDIDELALLAILAGILDEVLDHFDQFVSIAQQFPVAPVTTS